MPNCTARLPAAVAAAAPPRHPASRPTTPSPLPKRVPCSLWVRPPAAAGPCAIPALAAAARRGPAAATRRSAAAAGCCLLLLLAADEFGQVLLHLFQGFGGVKTAIGTPLRRLCGRSGSLRRCKARLGGMAAGRWTLAGVMGGGQDRKQVASLSSSVNHSCFPRPRCCSQRPNHLVVQLL